MAGYRLSVMKVKGLPMTLLTGTVLCPAMRYTSLENQFMGPFTYSLVHHRDCLRHVFLVLNLHPATGCCSNSYGVTTFDLSPSSMAMHFFI